MTAQVVKITETVRDGNPLDIISWDWACTEAGVVAGSITVETYDGIVLGFEMIPDAGLTRASSHVAYPNGVKDANTLIAMAATGMITGRVAVTTPINYMGLNNILSLYNLPVGSYVLRLSELNDVKAQILSVKNHNNICAVLFHGIADVPSGDYQWATSDFIALLAYINSLGMQALTISEWYALYDAAY